MGKSLGVEILKISFIPAEINVDTDNISLVYRIQVLIQAFTDKVNG